MRSDEEAERILRDRLSSTDGAPRLNSCWCECNRSGGLRARRPDCGDPITLSGERVRMNRTSMTSGTGGT